MIFKQYELGCLSLFSYLIGDETTGRAVVIDPQRDVTQYVEDAEHFGLTIERVLETHFHADFLSGHLELAAATGALISFGAEGHADFAIDPMAHGQQLSLGDVTLQIRHTPGHTPESISIVVWEHATDDVPWAVSPATRSSSATSVAPIYSPRSAGPLTGSLAASTARSTISFSPFPTQPASTPPTVPVRPAERTSPLPASPRSASNAAPTTHSPQ